MFKIYLLYVNGNRLDHITSGILLLLLLYKIIYVYELSKLKVIEIFHTFEIYLTEITKTYDHLNIYIYYITKNICFFKHKSNTLLCNYSFIILSDV